MSDSKDTQEPSMEEILSSIRRIIADEEDDGPTPPPGGSPAAAHRGTSAGRAWSPSPTPSTRRRRTRRWTTRPRTCST
jgi:cell pole-organizing protein PopZ